ncbi:MAG TPA: aldo/keto reductase [Phycisphaerales bacterium]|nr:aldo/keto reductase [Phycisphaerales bacterium]
MEATRLELRQLGQTDLLITPIGFGAFKIGRNIGIKYQHAYSLPTDAESDALLAAVVDELGINYIDTAPAYGLSEERVGRALGARKDVVISTKVGETFEGGVSRFDFSAAAVRQAIATSRRHLRREALDLVFAHSSGDDVRIIEQTDVVACLVEAKRRGEIRWIGFSGKTVEGAHAALPWADAIMVEYHPEDLSQQSAMGAAAARGVGVVVKKGLASGRLPARQAIRFVLATPAVSSMVIGGLSLGHLRENITIAANTQRWR